MGDSMEGKTIIGITGGVGAGKSTVLRFLKESYGARVILADSVAHDLMEPGSEGLKKVVEVLGDSFLSEDGAVDKKALSDLLFRDRNALETVNRIIHPMVWAAMKREALEAPERLVVIEAAVFDTAPEGFFDGLWYIYAGQETRIRRLMENRGYTREKCESIIAKQDTEDGYKNRCDRVIATDGSGEEMKRQLEEILHHEIC